MNKLAFFFLPLLFLTGCTDSDSDTPKLEITGVYIVGDEEEVNYADNPAQMPLLQQGDKVDILFDLSGNGNDLRTFVFEVDESKKHDINTLIFFIGDEISQDLSDIANNVLVFNDGVENTGLSVQAEIMSNISSEFNLSFFLFSKAFDGEGAKVELKLHTRLK